MFILGTNISYVLRYLQDIVAEKYRVVILTPELLLQRGGRCETVLWNDKRFVSKIQNIVFDEGHCIVQWGDAFRGIYGHVNQVAWSLLGIPLYISSATIPPSMISALEQKFNWNKSHYVLFKCSNDCPNINYAIRRMKYPQSSYEDLAFLVPKDWKASDPVPKKFMAFFDNKREAESAAEYLRSRVSQDLQDKVPWFHAGMMKFFHTEEVDNLRNGTAWGFTTTDSGGMVRLETHFQVVTMQTILTQRDVGARHR